jgi:DME family drug/metabolite transporter
VLRAKLFVVAGALLFSTGGAAIKLSSLTGWQVSCLRSGIAALVLLVLLPRFRSAWSWRSLVVAVPYATTFTLFTLANKLTTAANAIFLQDTAPLYIVLLGPILLREHVRRADLLFMLMLVIGLGLIVSAGIERSATASDPGLGNLLGAASGVSWALTVLGLRWLAVGARSRTEHPINAILAGCALASLVALPLALPLDDLGSLNWSIMAYLGMFQIALAYLLVTEGIQHVSALEASLLLLVEPVASPLWVWLFLAEAPGPLALIGGALVIVATVVYTARRERPLRDPSPAPT